LVPPQTTCHLLLCPQGIPPSLSSCFSPSAITPFHLQNNDGAITDFLSFYHLPSSIIGHPKYTSLHAAYSYYNVATTIPILDLFKDALTLAKTEHVDVYNCLDLMENRVVFEDLKFGIGDGNLQYYLYNWKCPEIEPNETGLVLL
jgi:glycylpeptide N-tetradecanoyltransferase